MDEQEEEMMLASPGGVNTSPYQGFERSIDAQIGGGAAEERVIPHSAAGYASSSDADVGLTPSSALPRIRTRDSATNANLVARQASYAEYSGADRTSFSSFSDFGGVGGPSAARLSALSLAHTLDAPRPSTSSAQPPPTTTTAATPVYSTTASTHRPSIGARNTSQLSITPNAPPPLHHTSSEAILHNSWTYLLKSKSGVRQWKKLWLVVRPKGLALYKNEDEYAALLILGADQIIDAVQIDPVSRTKLHCMQVITEERRYKFCAMDEESSGKCLGALKEVVGGKKARLKGRVGSIS